MAEVPKQKAKDVIQKFNSELLEQLPLEDTRFFAKTYQAKLIPLGSGDVIQQEKSTRSDKVSYYLNSIVIPGAHIFLPKLLEVMKECDNIAVAKLADDINKALQESGSYS